PQRTRVEVGESCVVHAAEELGVVAVKRLQTFEIGAGAHDLDRLAGATSSLQGQLDALVPHQLHHDQEEVLGSADLEAVDLHGRVDDLGVAVPHALYALAGDLRVRHVVRHAL